MQLPMDVQPIRRTTHALTLFHLDEDGRERASDYGFVSYNELIRFLSGLWNRPHKYKRYVVTKTTVEITACDF